MMSSLERRICYIALLLVFLLGRGLAMNVSQQGNLLLVDGKPATLTFARGCTNPADVPAYRAQGFNTLLVRVDSPGTVAMESAQALLDAAEKEGLYSLVELANGSWSDGDLACLSDREYLETAEYFLDTAMDGLRGYPHLVGWIVGTVEEGRLITNVPTVGEFMRQRYGTLEKLNAAWSQETDNGKPFKARVPSFGSLTEQGVEALANGSPPAIEKVIRRQLEAYRALRAMNDTDFQHYLKRYYQNVNQVNTRWGFKFPEWSRISVDVIKRRGLQQSDPALPAQLDLARYKSEVRRYLLEWWAQQILVRDEDRLVFAGGMTDYRGMSNLPPQINGVFTECYPGVTEVDPELHNPHASDIARHGNRFIVLAGISARNAEPYQFAYYLYGAAMHGASGIGVNDWDTVSGSPVFSGVLAKSLQDIGERGLLGRTPASRIGIVYTPYAPGQYTSGGRPLYGYMPPFTTDGPGTLMFMLRNGTCYGQIDYLSAEDLALVPLSRYQVLLLITALDTPPIAMQALTQYVSNGGLLIADIGAGTLQANGNHIALPAPFMQLFRVQNRDTRFTEGRYNLEMYRSHPLFPRLVPGLRTLGLFGGYAVRYTARFVPLEGSDIFFTLTSSKGYARPEPHPYKPLPRVPTRAVFISGYGKGLVLFAPLPLYQCWLPGNVLFEEFHRDLFGRNADIMFQRPIDFLPPRGALTRYADGSVAMWAKDDMPPIVWLRNPERRVYRLPGGFCEVMPVATNLYSGSPGYHLAEPLPVRITRMDLPVSVGVLQADDKALMLQFRIQDDIAGEVITVEVGDGTYRVAPGSVHRLIWLTDHDGGEKEITADQHGLLHVDVPLSQKLTTITITGKDAGGNVEVIPAGSSDLVIEAVPGGGAALPEK
ncbi:MAG: hypothetical protein ACYC6A_05700 [Armatimonadota bacterium]